MNYINHKTGSTITTVEDIRDLSKQQKLDLLKEYQLSGEGYYFSQRATKDYHKVD